MSTPQKATDLNLIRTDFMENGLTFRIRSLSGDMSMRGPQDHVSALRGKNRPYQRVVSPLSVVDTSQDPQWMPEPTDSTKPNTLHVFFYTTIYICDKV